MMDKTDKQMSKRRRAFLIIVGYISLGLDRLEGKRTEAPRRPVKSGRIKIVS